MTDAEVASGRGSQHIAQIPVAWDALAIVVNESNPVDALTLPDLARVFRGEVVDWKELGGSTRRSRSTARDHNSNRGPSSATTSCTTRTSRSTCLNLVGTASIVDSVAKDANGIGYGGIAYAAGSRTCASRECWGGAPVAATVENVRNGTHPLARKLWFHVAQPTDDDTTKFLAWVLSPAGGGRRRVGFYPLQRRRRVG